jgi:SAM-dependent methyltransferase
MQQVDYGIDKPERVRALGMVGLVIMATGVAQFIGLAGSVEVWPEMILSICLWIGILLFITAGVMLWSSKAGKFGLAHAMVEDLNWTGHEKVLDVGCGRGMLTILAARKVPVGDVVGVDTWSQEHLSENSMQGAEENARIERMNQRVTFEESEATSLGFSQNSFDKVVSSLAVHRIKKRSDRDKAVEEMIRVLRPGGELAILDILHTREYEKVMLQKGMKNLRRSPMKFLYCMPTRYIIAEKAVPVKR